MKETGYKWIFRSLLILAAIVLLLTGAVYMVNKELTVSSDRLYHFSDYRDSFQILAKSMRMLFEEERKKCGESFDHLVMNEITEYEWEVLRYDQSASKPNRSFQITLDDVEAEAYASIMKFRSENRAAFYGIRVTYQHVFFTFGKKNITTICFGVTPPAAEKGYHNYVDRIDSHWFQVYSYRSTT